MLFKLLSYEDAKEKQWRYERPANPNLICGLPKDWKFWGKSIEVSLVKEPIEKEMPVYDYHHYRLPAWLFECTLDEVYVPTFDFAKKLEAEHEPGANDDISSCVGIPSDWKGWGMVNKWTHYDTFDNYYLVDGSWWMPHWLVTPVGAIKEEA